MALSSNPSFSKASWAAGWLLSAIFSHQQGLGDSCTYRHINTKLELGQIAWVREGQLCTQFLCVFRDYMGVVVETARETIDSWAG